MSKPTPVTIGLPVYNAERFLFAALNSIRAQTFGDFVLVISDNASTDGTEEICRTAASDDPRIRYLRHTENRGAAWNFNRAFADCESPFFKWAAGDDLIAPTFVERCLEQARKPRSDRVVLVTSRTQRIDAQDRFIRDEDDRLEVNQPTAHARVRHVVENVVWGNATFGLIETDALAHTRGTGNYPSSDLVLLVELALIGRFELVEEPLFLRREHDGSSRQANASGAELARWFDPAARGNSNEFRRVFLEYLAGVKHAQLPPVERARCYGAVVGGWRQRYGGPVQRLRRSFGPISDRTRP